MDRTTSGGGGKVDSVRTSDVRVVGETVWRRHRRRWLTPTHPEALESFLLTCVFRSLSPPPLQRRRVDPFLPRPDIRTVWTGRFVKSRLIREHHHLDCNDCLQRHQHELRF